VDQLTGRPFVIDTGASYSIFPHRSTSLPNGPLLTGAGGHHLSAEGVEPLPENVSAVTDFSRPSTMKELQMFLGMVNVYRRFLPGAARALKPLTDCLRGGPKGPTVVEWNDERQAAFTKVKQMLAPPPPGWGIRSKRRS
jgi:hypothetical protein